MADCANNKSQCTHTEYCDDVTKRCDQCSHICDPKKGMSAQCIGYCPGFVRTRRPTSAYTTTYMMTHVQAANDPTNKLTNGSPLIIASTVLGVLVAIIIAILILVTYFKRQDLIKKFNYKRTKSTDEYDDKSCNQTTSFTQEGDHATRTTPGTSNTPVLEEIPNESVNKIRVQLETPPNNNLPENNPSMRPNNNDTIHELNTNENNSDKQKDDSNKTLNIGHNIPPSSNTQNNLETNNQANTQLRDCLHNQPVEENTQHISNNNLPDHNTQESNQKLENLQNPAHNVVNTEPLQLPVQATVDPADPSHVDEALRLDITDFYSATAKPEMDDSHSDLNRNKFQETKLSELNNIDEDINPADDRTVRVKPQRSVKSKQKVLESINMRLYGNEEKETVADETPLKQSTTTGANQMSPSETIPKHQAQHLIPSWHTQQQNRTAHNTKFSGNYDGKLTQAVAPFQNNNNPQQKTACSIHANDKLSDIRIDSNRTGNIIQNGKYGNKPLQKVSSFNGNILPTTKENGELSSYSKKYPSHIYTNEVELSKGLNIHENNLQPVAKLNMAGYGVSKPAGYDVSKQPAPINDVMYDNIRPNPVACNGVDEDTGYGSQIQQQKNGPNPTSPGIKPSRRLMFEKLKAIDWVQGYYSEGGPITVYTDLKHITREVAYKELAFRTGQSKDMFVLEHEADLL